MIEIKDGIGEIVYPKKCNMSIEGTISVLHGGPGITDPEQDIYFYKIKNPDGSLPDETYMSHVCPEGDDFVIVETKKQKDL